MTNNRVAVDVLSGVGVVENALLCLCSSSRRVHMFQSLAPVLALAHRRGELAIQFIFSNPAAAASASFSFLVHSSTCWLLPWH